MVPLIMQQLATELLRGNQVPGPPIAQCALMAGRMEECGRGES